MVFLGGLIGLLLGLALGAVVLALLGLSLAVFGPLAALLTPIVSTILALVGPMSPVAVVLLGLAIALILTAIAYTLAALTLVPLTAAAPTAGVTNPLAAPPLEAIPRGFIIGLTAAINFTVMGLLVHPVVGLILGLICFLAVIPPVSRSFVYQIILGWSSWLQPMTYLVMPLGILLFIVNLIATLIGTAGLPALRFDATTATIETLGGVVVAFLTGLTGFTTGGFNLGNFTFLGPAATATSFTPGAGGGLSTHETGHTLTVAAFGGFFGWINAIDENIPPLRRMTLAYGEMIPESHFARFGLFHVREWS
jgi:hypothetical protein